MDQRKFLILFIVCNLIYIAHGCEQIKRCEQCLNLPRCTFVKWKNGAFGCVTKSGFNPQLYRATFRDHNMCKRVYRGNIFNIIVDV